MAILSSNQHEVCSAFWLAFFCSLLICQALRAYCQQGFCTAPTDPCLAEASCGRCLVGAQCGPAAASSTALGGTPVAPSAPTWAAGSEDWRCSSDQNYTAGFTFKRNVRKSCNYQWWVETHRCLSDMGWAELAGSWTEIILRSPLGSFSQFLPPFCQPPLVLSVIQRHTGKN